MAINETVRDALITALEAGTGEADGDDFAGWANSLLELNQLNSEVRAEILHILANITVS